MKKFLICLVFILMAGVGYGFSSEAVPEIEQDEYAELSVDNTVTQNVNYVVTKVPAFKSVSYSESMGESFEFYSSKEVLVIEPLISGILLEPDLLSNKNIYNFKAALKNSGSNLAIYRRARDGLQNG